MIMDEPVMNDDASDSKNITAWATSSGCPNLRKGYFFLSAVTSSSENVFIQVCKRGVSMIPGRMQFILIFREASSKAAAFVYPIIADLEAA